MLFRSHNVGRLRGRVRANPESLNAATIQSAIGKTPIQQRVWGIAGQAPIGVSHRIPPEGSLCDLLKQLRALEATRFAQCIQGTTEGVQMWFRGPRPLGDFLTEWSQAQPVGNRSVVRLLAAPPDYVAIPPDDILAMQELHLSRAGMSNISCCHRCKSAEVQPIVKIGRAHV